MDTTKFGFNRTLKHAGIDDILDPASQKEVFSIIRDKDKLLSNVFPTVLPITEEALRYYEDSVYQIDNDIDMMILFKVMIQVKGDMTTSLVVTDRLLESLDLKFSEVVFSGKHNAMKFMRFQSFNEVLTGMVDEDTSFLPFPDPDPMMYIVSYPWKLYGAGIITCYQALQAIRTRLQSDYWIIPSSIHELIVVKTDFMDAETIKNIIAEVNDSQLDPEERLSYSVFRYSKEVGYLEKF